MTDHGYRLRNCPINSTMGGADASFVQRDLKIDLFRPPKLLLGLVAWLLRHSEVDGRLLKRRARRGL